MTVSRQTLLVWARDGAWLAGIGTFLAVLGPYGTQSFGWPGVWLYWTGLIILGGVFGQLGGRAMRRLRPHWPRWTHYAAAAVILTLPVTAAVFVINTLHSGAAHWSALPQLAFFVLVIAGGVFVAEAVSVLLQTGWFKVTRRTRGAGRRLFLMAPLHHHFEKLGWYESKVVIRFYILCVLCAVLALSTLKLR